MILIAYSYFSSHVAANMLYYEDDKPEDICRGYR